MLFVPPLPEGSFSGAEGGDPYSCVAASACGRWLAAGRLTHSGRAVVERWDTQTGELLPVIRLGVIFPRSVMNWEITRRSL